ncbi:hypothetical protein GCM10009126_29170 [Rhodanobacter caeni]|uniref:Uncharacterized protein n=1 Tax=Rhodanobacter caeni TaxID=657654 RepID=A0ABN0UUD4_9GAMM
MNGNAASMKGSSAQWIAHRNDATAPTRSAMRHQRVLLACSEIIDLPGAAGMAAPARGVMLLYNISGRYWRRGEAKGIATEVALTAG